MMETLKVLTLPPHPSPSSNITGGILIIIFIRIWSWSYWQALVCCTFGNAVLTISKEFCPRQLDGNGRGGGILSGHRSPILTSAICDQLAKICSPNSDLKYIKIYVEDISQFFYFSTLVKIGPNRWYMSFCCFVCPDNVSWSRFRVFVSLSLSVHVSRSALCVGQFK